MHIVVCLKQVPESQNVRIDPKTNTLIRQGVASVLNPFDYFALEAALTIKDERLDTKVTAITMGPPQAKEVLMDALSRGADDAILISHRAFAGADTWATSFTLAAAIRRLEPVDLIVCGKQAIDGDTAQVGPELATILNRPYATYVKSFEFVDDSHLKITRQTDEGVAVWRLPLPALVTVLKDVVTDAGKVRTYIPNYLQLIKDLGLTVDKGTVKVGGSDFIAKAGAENNILAKIETISQVFKYVGKDGKKITVGELKKISKAWNSLFKENKMIETVDMSNFANLKAFVDSLGAKNWESVVWSNGGGTKLRDLQSTYKKVAKDLREIPEDINVLAIALKVNELGIDVNEVTKEKRGINTQVGALKNAILKQQETIEKLLKKEENVPSMAKLSGIDESVTFKVGDKDTPVKGLTLKQLKTAIESLKLEESQAENIKEQLTAVAGALGVKIEGEVTKENFGNIKKGIGEAIDKLSKELEDLKIKDLPGEKSIEIVAKTLDELNKSAAKITEKEVEGIKKMASKEFEKEQKKLREQLKESTTIKVGDRSFEVLKFDDKGDIKVDQNELKAVLAAKFGVTEGNENDFFLAFDRLDVPDEGVDKYNLKNLENSFTDLKKQMWGRGMFMAITKAKEGGLKVESHFFNMLATAIKYGWVSGEDATAVKEIIKKAQTIAHTENEFITGILTKVKNMPELKETLENLNDNISPNAPTPEKLNEVIKWYKTKTTKVVVGAALAVAVVTIIGILIGLVEAYKKKAQKVEAGEEEEEKEEPVMDTTDYFPSPEEDLPTTSDLLDDSYSQYEDYGEYEEVEKEEGGDVVIE